MQETDKNIIILKELESTNNYANQLVLSNAAEEGTVVLAHYQKRGKGQPGNSWESEAGKNLLASIILYPGFLPAGQQFLISKMVSLSIRDALKDKIDDVKIKWPNDIYVGNKKIAGILIENTIKGQNLEASIIGIGLNVNQETFLSDAPNPVSLTQISGKEYKVGTILHEITSQISVWYKRLEQGNIEAINSSYFSQLFRKEEWHLFKQEDVTFEAKIVGIGEFGQLRLVNNEGKQLQFMFKEIEFVI